MIKILNLHRAVVQANSCLIKQVPICPSIIRKALKLIPGEIAREVFLPPIQFRVTEGLAGGAKGEVRPGQVTSRLAVIHVFG